MIEFQTRRTALRRSLPAKRRGERRRKSRLRTVYRVARVVRDKAAGLWRVRNISDFGMMLATRARPARGETLSIALSDAVSLEARVIWCDEEACGVEFDRPVDSATLLRALADEQQQGRGRAPRIEADLPGAARGERGVKPIRIGNLSQKGLGFSHDGWAQAGMKLLVLLDGGIERRGIVRWVEQGRAGLELLDPLGCDELERLCAG